MSSVVLSLLLASGSGSGGPGSAPSEPLLRQLLAETALAQLRDPDPRWQESQRDCAGLVRFAYRAAYARLAPERELAGLFAGDDGKPSAFSDARTLIATRFQRVGRTETDVREALSGDVLAFQQGPPGEEVMHLMLVVRPGDPAHGPAIVVYHTGTIGVPLRAGTLDALVREAPQEWRPVADNSAFLGLYRWEEFCHG